jgi:hypothetical protein
LRLQREIKFSRKGAKEDEKQFCHALINILFDSESSFPENGKIGCRPVSAKVEKGGKRREKRNFRAGMRFA